MNVISSFGLLYFRSGKNRNMRMEKKDYGRICCYDIANEKPRSEEEHTESYSYWSLIANIAAAGCVIRDSGMVDICHE